MSDHKGNAIEVLCNSAQYSMKKNVIEDKIKNDTYEMQREQTRKCGGHAYCEGGDDYKRPTDDHGKYPTVKQIAENIGKLEIERGENPPGIRTESQKYEDELASQLNDYYYKNRSSFGGGSICNIL